MADGRQFPQHDSGPDSADTTAGRAVIFATDRRLGVPASSDRAPADGNFSTAPRAFPQTYATRAIFGERSVTSAYVFLSRKTRDSYENLLNALVNRCAELGSLFCPRALNTDFESAMLQASQLVFGQNCRKVTFYYHLSQPFGKRCRSTSSKLHIRKERWSNYLSAESWHSRSCQSEK